MIFKDYYKILGLETNKVSVEEIKIAYREQAKKYHPDLNAGDNRYEERLKDINEAYLMQIQEENMIECGILV
jgi:curved DNA-binding protein CbpA